MRALGYNIKHITVTNVSSTLLIESIIMAKGKRYGTYRKSGGASQPESAAAKFKSTIIGLEHKVFTIGTAKDAAAFEETKTSIARYVGTQSWRGSAAASSALETLTEPSIILKVRPKLEKEGDIELFKLDTAIWLEDMKEHRVESTAWKENKSRMYNIVLCQCPKDLDTQLQSLSTWSTINLEKDVVGLLKLIRDVTHKHDETQQGTMALVESDMRLYLTHMKPDEDPNDFMEIFKTMAETINVHGGQAGLHPRLLEEHKERLLKEMGRSESDLNSGETDALGVAAVDASCEEYLSCLFIRVSDNTRFKGLKEALDNQFLLDKSAYPQELSEALKLLKNFKVSGGSGAANRAQQPETAVPSAGLAFAQASDQCFACGGKGHHASECPNTSPDKIDAVYAARKEMLAKKHKAFLAAKEQKATSGVAQLNAASSTQSQGSELKDKYHGDQDYMDYQQAMGLLSEEIGMVQVGNIGSGTNFLLPGESGANKTVSFADVVKKGIPKTGQRVAGRVTLDPHKLYLDSCAT